MQWRILSAGMFLLGFLVMALSDFTTFFGITSVTNPLTAFLAVFGFVICVVAVFVLTAGSGRVGPGDLQTQLYGLVFFLAGLFHMTLGTARIYFGLTQADLASAVLAMVGGLILCLAAVASQALGPSPEPEPETEQF